MNATGESERLLYTVPEAAQALGVTPQQLRTWIAKGLVPVWKPPGCYARIRRSDLAELIERHVVPARRPS